MIIDWELNTPTLYKALYIKGIPTQFKRLRFNLLCIIVQLIEVPDNFVYARAISHRYQQPQVTLYPHH